MHMQLNSREMQWQLVVFDWDGTMVDSAARIVAAVEGAARSLALDPAPVPEIISYIGLSLDTMFMALHPDQDRETILRLCTAYRQHWLQSSVIDTPVFGGAVQCLQRLQEAGALLAVATGKSRRGLDRALDDTGLGHHFAATRTADEAFSKPNPQMLLDVLEQTGQDRQRTLMVGDTVYDIQMASNAGIAAIGVCWGSHSRKQLADAGALACFDDFKSVSDWITVNASFEFELD